MGKRLHKIFFLLLTILLLESIYWPTTPAQALNKVANWNLSSDASSWTITNRSGTNVCDNTTSATETSMATLAYDGTAGNPAGSFRAVTGTTKNTNYRGKITQQITTPGAGTVRVKGRLDYFASSSRWSTTANSSWVRLDLINNTDSVFVANLACISFNSNQAWTTTAFSSDINLTGGTTYTVRVTLRARSGSTTGLTTTLRVDNLIVNLAPTGLTTSAPADSTNASLNWTASTAGTGTPGLHLTNPYKIYRSNTSLVTIADFLADSATNSYTDSSTVGNTTYYYALLDVDTNNIESPLSNEVSLKTRPAAPGTPTFINVQETTLRVNWTAPTGGADSYKVERCAGSGCTDFASISAGVTNLYFDDLNLQGNTLYRYQIRGTNTTGDGSASAISEVTTPLISITITTDGSVAYGMLGSSSQKNTTPADLNDTQTVQNNGNVAEDLNIKTSNALGGLQWTIGSNPDQDVFVHEFSTDSGITWAQFSSADTYQTLTTNLAVNVTQNFDLRLTAPTLSSDSQEKSITLTIQAVTH